MKTVVEQIASALEALRYIETGASKPLMGALEACELHKTHICHQLDMAPSGSGFDNGTYLDWEASKPNRLVFTTSFHHMDEHGSYCGWSDHQVIVTPDLAHGFNLRVTGRDRRNIKEYIGEVFQSWLNSRFVIS